MRKRLGDSSDSEAHARMRLSNTVEPEDVEEPAEWWTAAVAGRELWTTLLPHFSA